VRCVEHLSPQQTAENGEGEDDVLILAALEVIADQVGYVPDEVGDLGVDHGLCLGACFMRILVVPSANRRAAVRREGICQMTDAAKRKSAAPGA
jgi:hypothetical protein